MKKHLLILLTAAILLLIPDVNFGQLPPLGYTSNFALFSATGAFNELGSASTVTGDVGTDNGAFNVFPPYGPGTLIGSIHWKDATADQAAIDVATAYNDLFLRTCNNTLPSPTLGNGQILTAGVYCKGEVCTLNGILILDGQNNPNAIFIFQIGGAFSTTAGSSIILTRSASVCNVFWQVDGEVDLGANSVFQGTIVANGAINLLAGATLQGRALTKAGAVNLYNNTVTLSCTPVPVPGGGCVIPTLSEWGLIILALLMMAAGMVYIQRRQYSFPTAGQTDATTERKNLLNRRSYFIILAALLGIAMVIFTVEIILSIEVPVRDIVGSMVSSVILAYILQLLIPSRKE